MLTYTSDVVIVTRHQGLVEFLGKKHVVGEVITHVTSPEQIEGKHVFGVLPKSLAKYCASVTELDLDLPPELRGMELSCEMLEEYGKTMTTYRVIELYSLRSESVTAK